MQAERVEAQQERLIENEKELRLKMVYIKKLKGALQVRFLSACGGGGVRMD